MERIFGFEPSPFASFASCARYTRYARFASIAGLCTLMACDNPGTASVAAVQPSAAGGTTAVSSAGAPSASAAAGAIGGASAAVSGAGAPALGNVAQGAAGLPASANPLPGAAGATPPPSAATAGNTGSAGMAATLPVEPVPDATLKITVPQVAPGSEDTQCVVVRLATAAPMNVIKLHNRLSQGSHHFIVTALTDPSTAERPLARCQGFGGSVAGAPLAITQAHDDYVHLPEGVGYRLEAGQVMHLEMHYINAGDRTLDITGTTDLFAAAPGVQIQEGAVLLVGTADFAIPAHGTLETAPKFLALPAGMEDVKFYAITGHTHRFGTDVRVSLASDTMAPVMPLYAPARFDWESPETKQLGPHVSVPKGGGFLLQCAWNNTTDGEIRWGESANAEMCFFWGYYYPRKDVFSIVVDNIDQDTLKNIASLPPSPPP